MERSLHRQLKERYGPEIGGRSEFALGAFRIDAQGAGRLADRDPVGTTGTIEAQARPALADVRNRRRQTRHPAPSGDPSRGTGRNGPWREAKSEAR